MERPAWLPLAGTLALAAAGLLLALLDWRAGVGLVGVAVLLAAGLRLALPPRAAGELVVRTRSLDAAVLLVLGVALLALAVTIPDV